MSKKRGDEYEDVTEDIVRRLAAQAVVRTIRLERQAIVQGVAKAYKFDLLWEVEDADGEHLVLLFECRHYKSSLKHNAVHAYKSQVEDVAAAGLACRGVMVTSTGYQKGAKEVADTYDIAILELREPTEADTAGRLVRIGVKVKLRHVVVRKVAVEVEEHIVENGSVSGDAFIDREDGTEPVRLVDLLLAGELTAALQDEPPTPIHDVRRDFDPPALLVVDGEPSARIRAATARVGESDAPPIVFSAGGLESIAFMLKDALGGGRIWFAKDGRHWSTDD